MSRDCSDEGGARPTPESILSVLHASGASPLTFWASATSTSHPSSSSASCTNRAPIIDSITARTRAPRSRSTSPRCNMKTGLLELAPRSHAGACHRGGPLSSQSKATAQRNQRQHRVDQRFSVSESLAHVRAWSRRVPRPGNRAHPAYPYAVLEDRDMRARMLLRAGLRAMALALPGAAQAAKTTVGISAKTTHFTVHEKTLTATGLMTGTLGSAGEVTRDTA